MYIHFYVSVIRHTSYQKAGRWWLGSCKFTWILRLAWIQINMNLQDGRYVDIIDLWRIQQSNCLCNLKLVLQKSNWTWQVHSTGIQTFTRHIPSFSFRKRSLSREKSCQARDSNFSSSLTIEDGFSYASFEAVGYDFNTIELSQLVRRVPFFDSKSSL